MAAVWHGQCIKNTPQPAETFDVNTSFRIELRGPVIQAPTPKTMSLLQKA